MKPAKNNKSLGNSTIVASVSFLIMTVAILYANTISQDGGSPEEQFARGMGALLAALVVLWFFLFAFVSSAIGVMRRRKQKYSIDFILCFGINIVCLIGLSYILIINF